MKAGIKASFSIAFGVLCSIASERASFADAESREQCASAAEAAQRTRDEGRYRRAREELRSCAAPACAAPIRKDCVQWLADVERDAPTVVLGAKDARGEDLVDGAVDFDGEPLLTRFDGKPLMVDVGEHTFTYRFPDGTVRERRVVLHAGEKLRPLVVTLDERSASGAAPERRKLLVPMVAAGIGVAALGSFAFFGLSGRNGQDELDRCKPFCTQDSYDAVRTKYLVADASLGVAVAALAAAAYLYFTGGSSSVASAKGPRRSGLLAGGGYGAFGGAF